MKTTQWNAKASGDTCVNIKIDEEIQLDGLEIILKNEFRIEIIKIKIEAHDFSICTNTCRPVFAQIENSVRYVDGSGADAYK